MSSDMNLLAIQGLLKTLMLRLTPHTQSQSLSVVLTEVNVFTKTVTIAASLYLATVLYGAEKAKPVHGSIKILQQKYCYSDAETFVVSLKLKLSVRNASERATYLPSDMTPFTGR